MTTGESLQSIIYSYLLSFIIIVIAIGKFEEIMINILQSCIGYKC